MNATPDQTTLAIEEIVSDPNVRGGRPVIKGTGLTVIDIYFKHTTGDKLATEDIAAHYGLTLGQVYAALAYFHLHQDEMNARVKSDEDTAEVLFGELSTQGKAKRLD